MVTGFNAQGGGTPKACSGRTATGSWCARWWAVCPLLGTVCGHNAILWPHPLMCLGNTHRRRRFVQGKMLADSPRPQPRAVHVGGRTVFQRVVGGRRVRGCPGLLLTTQQQGWGVQSHAIPPPK